MKAKRWKFKNLTIDDLHQIIDERVKTETKKLFKRYCDALPKHLNKASSSAKTGPIFHRQVKEKDMYCSYCRLRNHTRDQCRKLL